MNRAILATLTLAAATLAAQGPDLPPPGGPEGLRHPGQPGPGAFRPGPGQGGPEVLLRALGLTPDQDKAVRAILDRRRAAAMARHQAAGAKEEALRAAAEDPAATEARLRALHAEAGEARLQDLLDRHAAMAEVDALLTPDQRAKATRIRANQRREREARGALMEDLGGPGERP